MVFQGDMGRGGGEGVRYLQCKQSLKRIAMMPQKLELYNGSFLSLIYPRRWLLYPAWLRQRQRRLIWILKWKKKSAPNKSIIFFFLLCSSKNNCILDAWNECSFLSPPNEATDVAGWSRMVDHEQRLGLNLCQFGKVKSWLLIEYLLSVISGDMKLQGGKDFWSIEVSPITWSLLENRMWRKRWRLSVRVGSAWVLCEYRLRFEISILSQFV